MAVALEPFQHPDRIGGVGGFLEDGSVDHHDGIGAQDELARHGPGGNPIRAALAGRVELNWTTLARLAEQCPTVVAVKVCATQAAISDEDCDPPIWPPPNPCPPEMK